MSHLSLRERAVIIKERFELDTFDWSTLRAYYLRNRISFRKPNYKYIQRYQKEVEIKQQQLAFVEELSAVIKDEQHKEIVYLDETTFNMWQRSTKCWAHRGMVLNLPKMRGPSITMIGAISEDRGLVHYDCFQGTNNAQTFQKFLVDLKNKCAGRRTLVVLDNLKVHKSKKLDEIYD